MEVAVESLADALAAQRGGADRLESCAALRVDGLTPSMVVLPEVKRTTDLPVMVMIRPRAGDFCYGAPEIDAMRRDIEDAMARGADGFVFGALRDDGGVDIDVCRQLLKCCEGRPAVFHRAFDRTPDPFEALEQVIDLGFARVLTSGRCPDASQSAAADLIRRLIERANGRIEILPGGGIRPRNAAQLIRATRCTQVHSSCRGGAADGTDEELVRALRQVVDASVRNGE